MSCYISIRDPKTDAIILTPIPDLVPANWRRNPKAEQERRLAGEAVIDYSHRTENADGDGWAFVSVRKHVGTNEFSGVFSSREHRGAIQPPDAERLWDMAEQSGAPELPLPPHLLVLEPELRKKAGARVQYSRPEDILSASQECAEAYLNCTMVDSEVCALCVEDAIDILSGERRGLPLQLRITLGPETAHYLLALAFSSLTLKDGIPGVRTDFDRATSALIYLTEFIRVAGAKEGT